MSGRRPRKASARPRRAPRARYAARSAPPEESRVAVTAPRPDARDSFMSARRRQHVRQHRTARRRVGLALAGGGPLGGIYEIGALLALAEALGSVDLYRLGVF